MKFHSFCAANSGEGFISFFDTLLDEKNKKVYYIKGGPGSGKSTFMRSIAERAEQAEIIHCSGDPQSIDGVILPFQNTIIFDATSPHSHEPQYPGIGGEIIDFGIIWKSECINKNIIVSLTEQKKALYHSSYKILRAIKNIHSGVYSPLSKSINFNKVSAFCSKVLKQYALWDNRGDVAQVQKRFFSAISPDGLITFDETLDLMGKNAIILDDRWMFAGKILNQMDQELTRRGIGHINGYHPLFGKSTLQHIIIPSVDLSIRTKDNLLPIKISEENTVRTVSTQSFIDSNIIANQRNKLVFIKKIMKELLKLTVEQLSETRAIHLEIESEYSKGADFDSANFIKEKFINKIFP